MRSTVGPSVASGTTSPWSPGGELYYAIALARRCHLCSVSVMISQMGLRATPQKWTARPGLARHFCLARRLLGRPARWASRRFRRPPPWPGLRPGGSGAGYATPGRKAAVRTRETSAVRHGSRAGGHQGLCESQKPSRKMKWFHRAAWQRRVHREFTAIRVRGNAVTSPPGPAAHPARPAASQLASAPPYPGSGRRDV